MPDAFGKGLQNMREREAEGALSRRQRGIGERLDAIVLRPGVRETLRREVALWTTSDLPRDSDGILLRPFPVDEKREPNSRSENRVLLAAAYQAFFPAGEPILPAVFDITERPERLQWCGLIRAVGNLPNGELPYIDQCLEEFSAEFAANSEGVVSTGLGQTVINGPVNFGGTQNVAGGNQNFAGGDMALRDQVRAGGDARVEKEDSTAEKVWGLLKSGWGIVTGWFGVKNLRRAFQAGKQVVLALPGNLKHPLT